MSDKVKLPPITDYMRNCLRDQYALENPEIKQECDNVQDEIVLVVDAQLCDEIEEVKIKLNKLIMHLGHIPLTDDEFNMLFLSILDLDSDDLI